ISHSSKASLFPYTTLFRSYAAIRSLELFRIPSMEVIAVLLAGRICRSGCATHEQARRSSTGHALPKSRSAQVRTITAESVYRGRSEEHTSELQSLAYLVCG